VRILTAIFAALLLAACDRSDRGDNQILCALSGEAFYANPGAGQATFMHRVPSADPLCAKLVRR